MGVLSGPPVRVGASVAVGPELVGSGVPVAVGSGLSPVSSVADGSSVGMTVKMESVGSDVGVGSPPNRIPVAHRTPRIMATIAIPPTRAGINQERPAAASAATAGAVSGAMAASVSVLTIRTVMLSLPPRSFAAATSSCAASWG